MAIKENFYIPARKELDLDGDGEIPFNFFPDDCTFALESFATVEREQRRYRGVKRDCFRFALSASDE